MSATKKTKRTLTVIFDQLKLGMLRLDAARLAGISFETFCQWMKNDPDFADRVERSEAECRQRCVGIIQRAAIKQWQAAAWWLERKHPETYALRSHHEVSGPGGGPIPLSAEKRVDLSGLTTKQLLELKKALETSVTQRVIESLPAPDDIPPAA